jgi:hypothetical protein
MGNCKCSSNSGCCSSQTNKSNQDKKLLVIDFMYIDLSTCTRCLGTENNLEAAIKEASNILIATGVDVKVNKILVESEEQAYELGFVSSPTIRINGKDIQLDVRESICESCGDICGDDVDCRVWVYQGKEYTEPPEAMIIDAILKSIYGNTNCDNDNEGVRKEVPENLKKFFSSKMKR